MPFGPESLEVQDILSQILRKPSQSAQDVMKQIHPDMDMRSKIAVLSSVREVIGKQLKTELDEMPKLIHRLRFCWITLRLADNVLRKTKDKDFPSNIKTPDLRSLLEGVFPTKNIHDCLIHELCSLLWLDPKGSFTKHYAKFIKPSGGKSLEIDIIDPSGKVKELNLRRIINWIIRRNRYQYVEINDDSSLTIYFPYLIQYVQRELYKCLKRLHLDSIHNLTEEIENQINSYLAYNCLEGDDWPPDASSRKDIVYSFIKDNNLLNKIYIEPKPDHPLGNIARLVELEEEISTYAEENRKLEADNRELKEQLLTFQKKNLQVEQLRDVSSAEVSDPADLSEFLKIVDSKYSLDILRSIQIGEEQFITIKNFLAHFFYGLRKKGLVTYPGTEGFELHYDQSGLYQCVGFEVPPNGSSAVKVEKYGWALKREGKLFPIRKAIVRSAN